MIGNINNIFTKINKLEDKNKEKDNKIKELETKISIYEASISNTMRYPTYSLKNKSQISNNDISYREKNL